MKFNLKDIPKDRLDGKIKVGDMFPAKGGRGDTAAWVVAAVRGDTLHMPGVNTDGDIVSTSSYGAHAMEDRVCIGRCEELINKKFTMAG